MSTFKYEQHGPWQIQERHQVYDDPWLSLRKDDVIRPDGLAGTYSTVRIKPGVCVIPVDADGIVHLTREFHYAVGRVTIEGISGGIEEGETGESTAYRELQEELGIFAEELRPLGAVDPLTSALSSPTLLYQASNLRWGEASPEGTEQIERVSIPFEAAVQMVLDSVITHAPTATALLKIQLLINGKKLNG